MKKLGILLLSAALAVCGLAVFSACDEPEHTHSFGDWKVVAEPACTEEGLRERVCTCGEKESEEIEALGHTPGEAIKKNEVAATCTADGSYEEVVYCAVCGEELSRKAVEVTALGHDYVKGVCARCGEEEPFTEGLIFELSEDGASYAVTGYQGASTEVYIPSYYQGLPVSSIGDRVFEWCSSLTSIMISDSVISIGEWAFGGCSSLTSITIPDSVTSIGRSAFDGCSGLTSVTIPDSVTSIGKGAFGRCSRLKSISVDPQNQAYHSAGNCLIETQSKTLIAGCETSAIPADGSVTSIGDLAFYGYSSLTSIAIPDSVTSIGESAFYWCASLTSITIPDSVTSIGGGAFSECDSLTSVTIGNSVTFIGDAAFLLCDSLTSITIPDSVTSIGMLVFSGCSSLTNINIPDSVTSIGFSAFNGCSSLTSITIPDSVTSIGAGAFGDCNGLTSISVDPQNQAYHSAGNCLIETQSKTLIAGCLSSVVPADGSVTSIGNYAFLLCRDLTSITIPWGVASIGKVAFANCYNLTSIVIPDSVTFIDYGAFAGCESLETVYYTGSEAEWNEIEIGVSNGNLLNANIIFNYTGE